VLFCVLFELQRGNVIDVTSVTEIYKTNIANYNGYSKKLVAGEWSIDPKEFTNGKVSKDELLENPEFKSALKTHIDLIKEVIPPEMFADIIGHQITERKPGFVDVDLGNQALLTQNRMLDELQSSVAVGGKLHEDKAAKKDRKRMKEEKDTKKKKKKKKKKHGSSHLINPEIGGAVLDI